MQYPLAWRRPVVVLASVGLVGLPIGLAACGSAKPGAGSGGGAIVVTATDTACQVARTEAAAGTVVFSIANRGTKTTEFYVYAAGDRVMGEAENIAPGLRRDLTVELPSGSYETACKPGMTGRGVRGAFVVAGSHQPLTADAKLADATASYRRYVVSQTAALIDQTGAFVAAVKAGDAAKAKALYPVARTYWERIEPVAEIFGDLDPAIDGREGDLEPGQEFTGFHRLERDLWTSGDLSGAGPVADRLLADVRTIVARADTTDLSPLQLANGAKELLDEVATTKITGEEDRYSHTDLWDFAANVEGSKAAVAALRPVLDEREPAMGPTLDTRFTAVEGVLDRHRSGDGWRLHSQLSQADLKELADAVNALAEPVSRVAAVVTR